MRYALFSAVLLLAASPLAALQSPDVARVRATADADPTPQNLLAAAVATRNVGDLEAAEAYLDRAWEETGPLVNGLVGTSLMHELASGGGIRGVQRRLHDMSDTFMFSPQTIAVIAANYPEILADGEFDDVIFQLSPDATDPRFRCNCYSGRAWAHSLAGQEEQARELWGLVLELQAEGRQNAIGTEGEALARAVYARNLARAGRPDEARRQLAIAVELEPPPAQRVLVHRRRAQAFAELGDAPGAVEQLEVVLAADVAVNLQTLESRVTWDPVRDEPAFQELLARLR